MRSTDLRNLIKVKVHILGQGVGFSLVDSGQWTGSLWYWEVVGFHHACVHPRSTGLTEWYAWPADVELTIRGRAQPRVLIQAWELISKTWNRTEQSTCTCHQGQNFNDLGGLSGDHKATAMFVRLCIHYSPGCTVRSTSRHHIQSTCSRADSQLLLGRLRALVLLATLPCFWALLQRHGSFYLSFLLHFFLKATCPLPCLDVVLT